MITIDWILFVGMLAGTASLSAVMGLVIGTVGRRIHQHWASRKRAETGARGLLCDGCVNGRFGMPDLNDRACCECLSGRKNGK